jgi:integrase
MARRAAVTILEKMARTRGQRKGHVFEKSGYWLGRYRVDSADEIDEKTGKPKRERITVTICPAKGPDGLGKREASRIFQEEYLTVVNAANMRPSSGKPLVDFVNARFYPDYLPTLKPTGQKFYRYVLDKHVLPILGTTKLRDISVERTQALLTLKGKTLSTQTVVHIRNCLSAVLGHAKAMGWFYGELPTKGVRLPEKRHKERKAATWEQVCLLATALPEPCSTLVLFLALTGLRIGEAMGLRWQRVNLSPNPVQMGNELLAPYCLAVRENYVLGKYSTLKTKGSVRNVPIPEWFVSRLSNLKRNTNADTNSTESVSEQAAVFANLGGSVPLDQHNLAARVMKPVAKNLKMEWLSWHCLRHTAATLADQAGMSITQRKLLLGHADDAIAMHYTHAEMESLRKQVESMADPAVLNRKPPEISIDPSLPVM